MPIEAMPLGFGRLLKTAGEEIMPLTLCPDMENADIDEAGAIGRRQGFQRGVAVEFTGPVRLIAGFEDYDSSDFFIVVHDDGISKET